MGLGKIIGPLYRLFTTWNDKIYDDYLGAKCYKVITFDPRDEVIPALAALKFGVTKKI